MSQLFIAGGLLLSALSCERPDLAALTEGSVLEGFRVEALYVDGRDEPVGTRLVHLHTGLSLRLFSWDSVPQCYLWVNTVPNSDRGEPHTQEHLLLGKGNRGRAIATLEEMSLVESSAFTEHNRTVYHFSTTAGNDVFFDVFEARIQALLQPDYKDEEIRREVHHWGTTEVINGDGTQHLALEEKGTIYNEMDSSMQQPGWVLWSQIPKDLYGPEHPMAKASGGTPDAIRTLEPEHILSFRAANYHLANMGAIVFLPTELPLSIALDRLDTALVRLQPQPTTPGQRWLTEETLPPPATVLDRAVRELRYPNGDDVGPVTLTLAWPPSRTGERAMPLRERLLATLLMSGLAGAENTNLYKVIVDSRTREREIDATGVYGWLGDEPGAPLYLSVGGLSSALGEDDITWLTSRLRRELRDLAALPAGHLALVDLTRRLEASLVSWRRSMRDSMTGPPGFGARSLGSGWHDHLAKLDEDGGFRRPLLLDPQLAWVGRELARGDNPWAEYLARWDLLDSTPFVYVNRPSSSALAALNEGKRERVARKLAEITKASGKNDEQAALRAFTDRYDEQTAALDAAIRPSEARFLQSPPLTVDPELRWEQRMLGGQRGIPLVAGRFDTLLGAKTALMLDLGGTDPAHAQWLRILPSLLTEVGVIEDGAPVSNEEVIERLQREVLGVSASTTSNAYKGRIELVLSASGTDPEETRAALRWARTFLSSPDWRPENLPRMRDVIDEALDAARRQMQSAEESWANNPPAAWEHQDQPLQLHLWSFLTYEHDLMRLRYRLMDPDPPASEQIALLAGAASHLDRAQLASLLAHLQGQPAALPPAASPWQQGPLSESSRKAASDLAYVLGSLPDQSLASDWATLCKQISKDLAEPPAHALAELETLRKSMLSRPSARMYAAGGEILHTGGLDDALAAWSPLLEDRPPTQRATPASQPIRARVTARGGRGGAVHVGLVEPNRRSGIISVSAPLHTLRELSESALLDDLAVRTMGGGGGHSLFIRTWGAGLAYGNGSSARETSGRMHWAAERCPKIPQTTAFVIDTLAKTPIGPDIAEYAIASVFYSRSDSSPEARTSAMATDLIDGHSPEVYQAFREAILALRDRPSLASHLAARMPTLYGRLLPGMGTHTDLVPGALSFAIGDQAQLDAWRDWLAVHDGPGALFEVLYPRDFWLDP